MTKHRFEALDALRATAALVVLAHHLELHLQPHTVYLRHGYLAVDLFFMLSGFVIAFAYERRLREGMSLFDFATVRLVRLYPMILLGAVLGVLAWAATGRLFDGFGWALATQLLFIPQFWRGGEVYAFNGVQRSLFDELVVNFAYAAIARRLSDRLLLVIVLTSGVGLFVTAAIYGSLGVGWGMSNLIGGIVRAFFGFFLGVGGFRLWERRALPRITAPLPLLLAALPMIVVATMLPFVPRSWIVDPLVVVLLLPPLLWLTANVTLHGATARLALFAGALSYPVYALQGPVRLVLRELVLPAQLSRLAEVSLLSLAVLLAAWLALRFFDEPARSLLRSALRLRRNAEPAGTAP